MDAQQVQKLLGRAQALQQETAVADSRLEDSRTRLADLKEMAIADHGTDHIPTLAKTALKLETEAAANMAEAEKLLNGLSL